MLVLTRDALLHLGYRRPLPLVCLPDCPHTVCLLAVCVDYKHARVPNQAKEATQEEEGERMFLALVVSIWVRRACEEGFSLEILEEKEGFSLVILEEREGSPLKY